MANALLEVPPNYAVVRRYVLTERRLLLILNLAALLPIVVMMGVMALWQVFVGQLRAAGVITSLPYGLEIPWWLGLILVLIVVLPFHELLHGLAIRRIGHQVRYGIKPEIGVLYALAENALFRRNEYLFVLLTPLTVITLIGMALNLIVPDNLAYTVSLGVILNAGGAIGDLWMTSVMLRYPSRVIVRDDALGFTIFDQQDERSKQL